MSQAPVSKLKCQHRKCLRVFYAELASNRDMRCPYCGSGIDIFDGPFSYGVLIERTANVERRKNET